MYGRMNQGRGPVPPVNVGDEVDVTIEAVGEKGDGVAKVKGFVLFVPGVKAGDRIKVRVTKVLRKVGFAEKIGEAETPAPPPEPAPEEILEQPEEQPVYEDTEDFGEELEPEADEAEPEEPEKRE